MKGTRYCLLPSLKRWRITALTLGATLCLFIHTGSAQSETSPPAVIDKVESRVNDATQQIQETGQAALGKMESLWQRIDERRLKNRTPDELVAWVIMGLMVGSLLYRLGGRGQISSIVLGLIGAFLGGIVAHVAKLNFGMGPVLITYEDLLCSLAGGVLILGGTRWFGLFKAVKPRKE